MAGRRLRSTPVLLVGAPGFEPGASCSQSRPQPRPARVQARFPGPWCHTPRPLTALRAAFLGKVYTSLHTLLVALHGLVQPLACRRQIPRRRAEVGVS